MRRLLQRLTCLKSQLKQEKNTLTASLFSKLNFTDNEMANGKKEAQESVNSKEITNPKKSLSLCAKKELLSLLQTFWSKSLCAL
jgi:hypothetical protein